MPQERGRAAQRKIREYKGGGDHPAGPGQGLAGRQVNFFLFFFWRMDAGTGVIKRGRTGKSPPTNQPYLMDCTSIISTRYDYYIYSISRTLQ